MRAREAERLLLKDGWYFVKQVVLIDTISIRQSLEKLPFHFIPVT